MCGSRRDERARADAEAVRRVIEIISRVAEHNFALCSAQVGVYDFCTSAGESGGLDAAPQRRRGTMRYLGLIGTLAVSILVGCEPGPYPTFTLFNSAGADRAYLVPDATNVGGGPFILREVAGDVAEVRYRLDRERRSYLFVGDLGVGIEGGDYLLLPLGPGDLAVENVMDIAPFDSSKWNSFRVYDAGLCSLLLGWAEGAGLGGFIGIPPLAPFFVAAIDDAFTTSQGVVGGVRIGDGAVTPVLRAAGDAAGLDDDTDYIRIAATYFADEIATTDDLRFGCSDVTLTIQVEFGFRRVLGAISHAPGCLTPGDPGGFLELNDGFSYDHAGVVYGAEVSATTARPCSLADDIAGAMQAALQRSLPDAILHAVQNAGLVDPRLFGFTDAEIRPCTCDVECDEFAAGGAAYGSEGGRRPRCTSRARRRREPVSAGSSSRSIDSSFDRRASNRC
jgi:hypothetical protein